MKGKIILLAILIGITGSAMASHRDPWLGPDKIRHFLGSAVVTAGMKHQLAVHNSWKEENARAFSISIALSLGIAKELRDIKNPGSSASWRDLAADALGTVIGAMLP